MDIIGRDEEEVATAWNCDISKRSNAGKMLKYLSTTKVAFA